MYLKSILTFTLLLIFADSFEQHFASWDNQILTLDNGLVKRIVSLPGPGKQSIETTSIELAGSTNNFIGRSSDEFYFELDGRPLNGKSDWKLIDISKVADENEGQGALVKLTGNSPENKDLEISITYLLYPGSQVIRKNLRLKNVGSSEIKIESLDIESLSSTLDMTFTWIYNNYGRYKTMNGYTGNQYDPVVVLHQVTGNLGLVLGNEIPGVLKKTTAMNDGKTFGIGFNHSNDNYPLRKWIQPQQSWNSQFVFVAPYQDTSNPSEILNTVVADFVRKNMGIRLSKMPCIPTSVYNTWVPFRGDLTTASVLDVARDAAECGFQYFVIDAGWNTIDGSPTITGDKDLDWILNLGDWMEDREKFPNGMQEVFEGIQQLGMKPGLWISLATATKNAKVFRDHPEWFIKDKNGNPSFLHDESGNPNQVTACLGSGYYDYMKETILKFAREFGVRYVKLDLAVVTSAYRYNPDFTGCSADDHPFHKDREESYLAIYERCFRLFDELHEAVPDLFIDCTFETMGKLQLIDFAMLQHADGNWLTNIDEPAPKGSWRVRQMGWWRSPVIPASAMVIGNMILDEPGYYQSLMSLSGSMPILLGDTRKIAGPDKIRIKEWSQWMEQMNQTHQVMKFWQDLAGFGEPQDGCWDGFQRINTDSGSGGIVGVFRQGAAEKTRTVTVKYLNQKARYAVFSFPEGAEIGVMDGNKLSTEGFKVTLEKYYDGRLFEIRRVK